MITLDGDASTEEALIRVMVDDITDEFEAEVEHLGAEIESVKPLGPMGLEVEIR